MIDHDKLFKKLITTFFWEFLALFFPEVLEYVEPEGITFLEQEIFTDLTAGERREIDILAKVKFKCGFVWTTPEGANLPQTEGFFLIHIENQSYAQSDFARRMFHYFARLDEKHSLPVFPVVIFSYDEPKRPESEIYKVGFPSGQVLEFKYQAIQLNRLPWRQFISQENPVAAALMAKMAFSPQERPRVKLECLRLLTTLRLNPAKTQLISGFIDTYLRLETKEEESFQQQLKELGLVKEQQVMEIVTSWMEKGIEQGLQQGLQQGYSREIALVLRLLHRRVGAIAPELQAQVEGLSLEKIEALGEALLDFNTEEDLQAWLKGLSK